MNRHFGKTTILICLFVLIACLWWGDQISSFAVSRGFDNGGISLGDWGDSFSALNTLFSGLAFVGLGATVFLQIHTVRHQQQESSRAEFERIYFQIFSLIRDLRKELVYNPASISANTVVGTYGTKLPSPRIVKKTGSEALKVAYNDIETYISKSTFGLNFSKNQLIRLYDHNVAKNHEGEFSPYFRAVYSLLRRVDRAKFLDEDEKLEYSRLLRSQMTGFEAAILGINGLTDYSKDLSDYIIRFRMLKYCPKGKIRTLLEKCYPPETFLGR